MRECSKLQFRATRSATVGRSGRRRISLGDGEKRDNLVLRAYDRRQLERGELIWKFTRTGTVTFACLQSGHLEAGMAGAVAVH